MMRALDSLFSPASVAILGASADPARIGGLPLRYLLESGYSGQVFPVNANRIEVQGRRAWPSIEDIDAPIDCAVFALPSEAVLPALRQAASKGVRAAIVFSAGFAEAGAEGRARQGEMHALARSSGMRVLGPNCLGVFNASARAFLTFSGSFRDAASNRGRIGLVSQSGGYAGQLVRTARERGLAFGLWATTGNEVDIEAGELMHYMATHDEVDIIVAYLEGIRSRASFLAALEAARRNRKPIVLLKVGRSAGGARAASSHTDAVAGEDDLYEAIFREYGVYRAYSTEELMDVVYAAARGRFPRDDKLAILTHSGGFGALAADYACDKGLALAAVPPALRAALNDLAPAAATGNPVDVTALASQQPGLLGRCAELLMQGCECSSLFAFVGLLGSLPQVGESVLEGFQAAGSQLQDKVLAVSLLGSEEVVARYEAAGYLVFEEPARAVAALAALAGFARAWGDSVESNDTPTIHDRHPSVTGRLLNEAESKRIVACAGIEVPDERWAATPEDAQRMAMHFGDIPLALKIVSADVPHKSDVGGVALNLSAHRVAEVARWMVAKVAAEIPQARCEGFLVTPMETAGVEMFLGARRDPTLGPVIVVGGGGIAVELYRDVACALAPLEPAAARQLIRATHSHALLTGFRGAPPSDVDAFVAAVVAMSQCIAARTDIESIEINPLLVRTAGKGVLALDALVRLAHGSPAIRFTEEEAIS